MNDKWTGFKFKCAFNLGLKVSMLLDALIDGGIVFHTFMLVQLKVRLK